MSRSYSNFLLFEDVLDRVISDTPVMSQAINILLNPIVTIVEEDCGTLLGEQKEASFDLEGLTEVLTNEPITYSRIRDLVSQGNYRFGVRTLNTCMSYKKGGVCQKCYEATFLGETAPDIGTIKSIPASQIYQTDVIKGDGFTTKFTLSQNSDEFDSVKVIHQGNVFDPSGYTLGYDYIEFPHALPNIDLIGLYTIHFFKHNTEPFQGLISRTYGGALLGMQPLPTLKTIIRPSLYENLFSDGFLELLFDRLKTFKVVPLTYIDYIEKIHSRLEKVVMVLYMLSLYTNVEVTG